MTPQVKYQVVAPREPESLEQAGLAESVVEHLILKILYFRGEVYGQELSQAIGLRFSVIQDLVEMLKLQHLVQVKRSMGMGNVGSVLTLTEAGRVRTREYLEANQYSGPAPVPLDQYCALVTQQRPRDGWLTKEALRDALRGMVITERVLSQVGPAVSANNSLLIYGKPGDGKTFLIESLNNLDAAAIFVPNAIECQGNIVQVFDPVYHQRLLEDEPSAVAVSVERSYDRRWVKCKRPFIVSGGELTLEMLDLRFNRTSKVYEAPFQLKANNGVYLIDDFGRQRATPAEVLNRWIVPMERRVDYLSFLTGGKMTVPFETFLVFSTNLNPESLGDEAFLRRIQYKLLMRGPARNEFDKIFAEFCRSRHIPVPEGLLDRFIERHYTRMGKPFRRCHPRDVLTHALNLIHFEKLPVILTDHIMDRAFDSCFLSEEDNSEPLPDAVLVPFQGRTCGDHWSSILADVPTTLGCVYTLASFRDAIAGGYYDEASATEFGEAETQRTLAVMHSRAFHTWLQLTLEQKRVDFYHFQNSAEGMTAGLSLNQPDAFPRLAPEGVKPEELQLFIQHLTAVLRPVAPLPETREISVPWNG